MTAALDDYVSVLNRMGQLRTERDQLRKALEDIATLLDCAAAAAPTEP